MHLNPSVENYIIRGISAARTPQAGKSSSFARFFQAVVTILLLLALVIPQFKHQFAEHLEDFWKNR